MKVEPCGLVRGWMSHLSVWKVSTSEGTSSSGGEPSGQGPLGDVLLRQVVGHVAAQRTHRHRGHVTGAAVCRAMEEKAMTVSLLDSFDS